MLIAETQALLDQQKILRNISSNGPTDIKAKTGLLLKGVQLESKIEELNHCIDYQKQHNLELANTCGELVHEIEQSEDSKKRYEAINRTYQYALQQTRKIHKQQSEQQLIQEAENLIEKGAYLEAQVLLEEVIHAITRQFTCPATDAETGFDAQATG